MDFGVTDKKRDALLERMERCGLREKDFEEKFVRSSGPGGQNVNRRATCVTLKHRPSGLEVKMRKERTQALNRYYARKRMCELMEEKILGKKSPAAHKTEKIKKQKNRRKRRARLKLQENG